jgi:hypothetical protein
MPCNLASLSRSGFLAGIEQLSRARARRVETALTGLLRFEVKAVPICKFALADPDGRGDYGEEVRVLIVTVPDVLREKLGAEGARALAELLNQLGGQVRDAAITVAEERFERRLVETTSALETRLVERMSALETRLNERMSFLETRLNERMSSLESGLNERMRALESGLNERMRKLESRLLGWAFAFWVGQFAVLIGILFAFFRN